MPKTRSITDAGIEREILHALESDPAVPDKHIKLEVAEGVVTIEGTVTRDFQREAVEQCVRKVAGVQRVINLIEVDQ